jgi:uncharacterized protein
MKISIIPGLNNSGMGHWQTYWEEKYGFTRIQQDDWDNPDYLQWEKRLVSYIENDKHEKENILIAHSLGTILVVKALQKIQPYVKGIFLVATPDPDGIDFLKFLTTFRNIPSNNLGVPGYLVYSENDTYSTPAFSEKYSTIWGLKPVNIGRKGHINSESNIDEWKEGYEFFNQFLLEIKKNH